MVNGFFFPHHEDPRVPLRNTILDGELLIDQDPRTNRVRGLLLIDLAANLSIVGSLETTCV